MKKTILFVVTNGVGLGHLTRGLAVADRIKKRNSEINIIFVTTSYATELIRNKGYMYFYIPSWSLMPQKLKRKLWNDFLLSMLQQIIEFYHPSIMVYDGATVYQGIINSMRNQIQIKNVWIKREGYKKQMPIFDLWADQFDQVIVPKEVGMSESQGGNYDERKGKKRYVSPILLVNHEEGQSREEVRKKFHISSREIFGYISLARGDIDQITSLVAALSQYENIKILLGESPICYSLDRYIESCRSKVIKIKEYPNARYFKGLDFAISAAGYNTAHELVDFKVPTLFIPNKETKIDDQIARALRIENMRCGMVYDENEKVENNIDDFISRMDVLKEELQENSFPNGATEAAEIIISLL